MCSIRQPATVLLGRNPQGDGEPGYLEDDPGAVGVDARRAAKVHSTELGRVGSFKPGRQRTPMLNRMSSTTPSTDAIDNDIDNPEPTKNYSLSPIPHTRVKDLGSGRL